MEIEKIEEEIFENGNRKINIGVRAYAELKLKLTEESNSLGISLSEHCEKILITHSSLLDKIKILTDEVEELKQKNTSVESSLPKFDLSSYNKKSQKLNDENSLLKKKVMELNSNQQIYSDQRLESLFNKVKGKSDIIITDNGEMNIIYNTPKDVLLALIYSYKIKINRYDF